MPGAEDLLKWFDEGRLVRPSAAVPSFVDLVGALFLLAGVDDVETSPAAGAIARRIGRADHYVFVLADAMGPSALDKAPPGGFLRSHLAGEVRSVFPSSTAPALTTLATGVWPAAHAVATWYAYLDKFALSAVSLRFVERWSGRSLAEFGVKSQDVFTVPSVWPRSKYAPLTVISAAVADSVYTVYSSGGTPRAGYSAAAEAFDLAARHVLDARGPTITYLYLPQVDSVCNEKGTLDEELPRTLAALDGQIDALSQTLAGRARIIVAADHGQIDTPPERRFIFRDGEPLFDLLLCPPTGEPTVPIFHVKEGCEKRFADAFDARFGAHFALVTPDDAEDLALFGPVPLSPVLRRRLGTYVGIFREPSAVYTLLGGAQGPVFVGMHGGLTPEEMRIPLILA